MTSRYPIFASRVLLVTMALIASVLVPPGAGAEDAPGSLTVTQISNATFLRSDGTVWVLQCEGPTGARTLGTRQMLGVANITAISSGGRHSLVLHTDGSVWAWGGNAYGQLGTAPATGPSGSDQQNAAQISGLTNVSAVSSGGDFSLVLRSDGTVWAFGRNDYGQLGVATNAGTDDPTPTPTQVAGLPTISAISAGDRHALLLASDGTVWAFGRNVYGEVGNNTNLGLGGAPNPVATQVVGLSNVTAISAGHQRSVALRGDGTVWTFGQPFTGQYESATTPATAFPTPYPIPGLAGVTAVSAAGHHGLALTSAGTVFAFGANGYGESGSTQNIGTTEALPTATQVDGLAQITRIAATYYASVALRTNGTVRMFGQQFCSPASAGMARPEIIAVQGTPGALPRGAANDQVQRLYQAAFGRLPDTGGFDYWAKRYRAGSTLESLASEFVASAEFTGRYGTNPTNVDLVKAFYTNVLGRAGEQAGIDYWVGLLSSGKVTRVKLLMEFADSPENINFSGTAQPLSSKQSQVLRLYQAAFGRAPDQTGFDFWSGQYESGKLSLEVMAQAFAESPEFVSRFGTNVTNTQFVDAIYLNVLGRPSDAAGVKYWVDLIAAKTTTRSGVLAAISESPENIDRTGTVP